MRIRRWLTDFCYPAQVKRVNFNAWMFTAAMPRIALAAIFSIMAGLAVFALWQTMTASDQVDKERASVAINAMVLSHVQRLEIYTAEQAISDDIAEALYGQKGIAPSVIEYLSEQSLGDDHDIAFAFDGAMQQKFAVASGAVEETNFAQKFTTEIEQLRAQITETADCVGAVVWTQTGPRLLTVARVRPVTDGQLGQIAKSTPAYIAMSKPLSAETVAHIGKSLGIDNITVTATDKTTPSLESAALAQQAGKQAIFVYWQPAQPGRLALRRSLPPILAVLLGGIALVILISHMIGKLLSAALRDTLSHLPNRRSLELRIAHETSKSATAELALIDLDGFKRINDNHGHQIGDQTIKYIANLLISHSPPNATVSRLGGDEFAIFVAGSDNKTSLAHAIETFQKALSKPVSVGDVQFHLSATAGIASVGRSKNNSVQELLVKCDRALGVAKAIKRGKFVVYDAVLAREFDEQAELAKQVASALNACLLDVHFQPLACADTGHIIAAEALLRWDERAGIKAGPEQVVAAAEAHGLGMQLTLDVMRQACTHASRWPDVIIAVNITPTQFLDPELANAIVSILSETKLSKDRLELEVTESIAIADESVFQQQFERLHALGIGLALDDFGSGYASIGFLRRFPFTKLKIDKSLVDESLVSAGCRDMLIACVAAARALSIKTVAEGIETDRHRDITRAAGCDLLQGYYIAKPLRHCAFEVFLNGPENKAVKHCG